VNQDPGPSTTTSASRTASTAAAHAGAPAAAAEWNAPGRRRGDGRLARICSCGLDPRDRIVGSATRSRGTGLIGSTRPTAPTSSLSQASEATGSLPRSSSPVSSRLPNGCRPAPAAAESMLQEVGPRLVVRLPAGQGGQGHPQVTRRSTLSFAYATRGSAVVGDVTTAVRSVDSAQRRKATRAAVTAANATAAAVYSRPRSRCTTVVRTRSP